MAFEDSWIFKTFVNYCKLVVPGVKCVHAIKELWVSMPALLIPFGNSSEIHFTIKSPIETGKWGDWAGQWGGGGLYIPVNSELRMINTCPKKQEWNINKALPQHSFCLYIQTSSKPTKKLFFDYIDSPFSSPLSKLHSCSFFFPSHLEKCNPESLQNAAPRSMNI